MTAPLTPPDCDLRGIEPPWEVFIDMAVAEYGITRPEAEKLIADLRSEMGAVQ